MALPGNTNYQSILDGYRAKLAASPTAMTPGVAPTQSDLSLDSQARRAQSQADAASGAANRAAYYPAATPGEEPPSKAGTRLSTFLKTMGAPMSAGAGLVEAALGKGTKPGLDNVVANVQEGGDYGDIIRSYNVPNWIAAPLGFGLDIALDPLMWLTAGTEALVPRIGAGLVKGGIKGGIKGGLEGAALGAKSGVLSGLESAGRLVPGLEAAAFPSAEKTAQIAADAAEAGKKVGQPGLAARAYKSVSQMSVDASKAYDVATGGSSVRDIIMAGSKKSLAVDKALTWLSGMDKETGAVTSPLRAKIYGYTVGSPEQWFKTSMSESASKVAEFKKGLSKNPTSFETPSPSYVPAEDIPSTSALINSLANKAEGSVVPEGKVFLKAPTVADNASDATKILKDDPAAYAKSSKDATLRMAGEMRNAETDTKQIKDTIDALLRTNEDVIKDTEAGKLIVKRAGLLAENPEVRKIVENLSPAAKRNLAGVLGSFKTDVEAVDRKMAEFFAKNPTATKVFKAYAGFQQLFKTAKVPLNIPGAAFNSFFGNTVMTMMNGIDIGNAALGKAWIDAAKFAFSGKVEENLRQMLTPVWKELATAFPHVFRDVFNVDPRLIIDHRSLIKEMARDAAKMVQEAKVQGKNITGGWDIGTGTEEELVAAFEASHQKAIAKAMKGSASVVETTLQGAAATSYTSEQLIRAAGLWIKQLEREGNEGKLFSKFLHGYLTKPAELYGKSDQISKLSLAMHLSSNGITRQELTRLAPAFKIGMEDFTEIAGRTMVKLTPMKSMEIASRVYMNYAAMPAAVKMLRMLPIVGAPFGSFMYGAGQMTARTMIFNPAAFNKIQYALKELSGSKSPLEKQALTSQYYSWMDTPTMIKAGFLQSNPVYLNVANMVPYYSFSLLQQPGRDYGDKYGGVIAQLIDKSPFFKTPEGQLMLDYLIMPHLIASDNGLDQGMFGQPLYPINATAGQKLGSLATSAAETVMPSAAGYGALVPGLAGAVPDSALPYVPSYRFRQLANALKGRTSVGVPTKQNPTEKTALRTAGAAGFPLYKLDIGASQNPGGPNPNNQ